MFVSTSSTEGGSLLPFFHSAWAFSLASPGNSFFCLGGGSAAFSLSHQGKARHPLCLEGDFSLAEKRSAVVNTKQLNCFACAVLSTGARLLCSYRMPLPVGLRQQSRRMSEANSAAAAAAGDGTTERARTEPSAASQTPDPPENNSPESGMAWLEGPIFNGESGGGAVRVVLIDERLLAGSREEGGRARRPGVKDVDSGGAIGGAAGSCEESSSSQSRHASIGHKSPPLGEEAVAGEEAAVAPSDGFAPPPLLAGLASLGQNSRSQRFFSCASVLGDDDDDDSAGVHLAGTSRTDDADQYGNGTGSTAAAAAYNGSSSGGGGWFSEDDLLRDGGGVPGEEAAGGTDDDSMRGGSASCRRRHVERGSGVSLRGRHLTEEEGGGASDARNGERAAAAEKSGSAPARAVADGGAAESGAAAAVGGGRNGDSAGHGGAAAAVAAAVAVGENEKDCAPTGASERSSASGGIEKSAASEEQRESRQVLEQVNDKTWIVFYPRKCSFSEQVDPQYCFGGSMWWTICLLFFLGVCCAVTPIGPGFRRAATARPFASRQVLR